MQIISICKAYSIRRMAFVFSLFFVCRPYRFHLCGRYRACFVAKTFTNVGKHIRYLLIFQITMWGHIV